jgi:hypothetical protein
MRRRGSLSDAVWAYCQHCARDVELLPVGRLAQHVTHQGPRCTPIPCPGSLRAPTPRPTETGRDDDAR